MQRTRRTGPPRLSLPTFPAARRPRPGLPSRDERARGDGAESCAGSPCPDRGDRGASGSRVDPDSAAHRSLWRSTRSGPESPADCRRRPGWLRGEDRFAGGACAAAKRECVLRRLGCPTGQSVVSNPPPVGLRACWRRLRQPPPAGPARPASPARSIPVGVRCCGLSSPPIVCGRLSIRRIVVEPRHTGNNLRCGR